MTETYYFDEAWPEERARLAALEVALDPGTISHLRAIGVPQDAACLEVGAGGGSITSWLCEQVGVEGRVVACDVQTKFVAALDFPQLTVWQHDVSTGRLPIAEFDVVHVRWTLFWLSAAGRQTAIEAMFASLKPGGWLVAEEPDFLTLLQSPLPEPLKTVIVEHVKLITSISRDADPGYGRTLFSDLYANGASEITTAGRTHIIQSDRQESGGPWLRFALERLRDQLVAAGAVSSTEFDHAMRQFDQPGIALFFPVTVAVCARRSLD
jgi:SAM-dependent methyltransferase